jgi:hypothetical protein
MEAATVAEDARRPRRKTVPFLRPDRAAPAGRLPSTRRRAGEARRRPSGRDTVRELFVALVGLALAVAFLPGAAAQAQNRRGGPRVIQLEEVVIEGRVQKPNAFYILNRSNLGYEVEDLRANFMVRNVLDSVTRDEF